MRGGGGPTAATSRARVTAANTAGRQHVQAVELQPVDGDERDGNNRRTPDSSGGLPCFHLWNVHMTNCDHFLSAEEPLQACSSFQCQMFCM